MYTHDNFALAKEEIKSRRMNAISTAESRNAELAEKYPDIREIDEQLRGTGLLLFKTACNGGDIEKVKKDNQALMAKRRSLLKAYGYPEDYTDVHYTCSKCLDSGYVDTKICSCLKELLITKNIESSGMGRLMDKQSFDSFDLSWYKDNDAKIMKANYDRAVAFAEKFGTHQDNLFLIGTTGTGKTHISTSIAKAVIAKGFSVLYDSAQNIVSAFEDDKFRSGFNQTDSKAEKYLECELLIIDDLGTEFVTQFSTSCMYNLITTRQNRGLNTIISTNLSFDELRTNYSGRITSRLMGSDYQILTFCGADYRIFHR